MLFGPLDPCGLFEGCERFSNLVCYSEKLNLWRLITLEIIEKKTVKILWKYCDSIWRASNGVERNIENVDNIPKFPK